MSVWSDLVGGGLVKPIAEAGVDIYKDRGETQRTELKTSSETQQAQVSASAAINAGASTWRPRWMHSIRQLLSMYFILSFVGGILTMLMLIAVFMEYVPYARWAAVKEDFVWFLTAWGSLGGSLITVATWSFLGYSPFRSIFDKGNATQAGQIVDSVKDMLPSRKTEVVREEMKPPPGKIERIPGVQVRVDPSQDIDTFGYHPERTFTERSLSHLKTCHPDLQKVAHRALQISRWDFACISGHRTIKEQVVLVKNGKSETMNSGHVRTPATAVDVYVFGPDGGTWQVDPYYLDVRAAFAEAARDIGISMRPMIQLKEGPDAGHHELSPMVYTAPDIDLSPAGKKT